MSRVRSLFDALELQVDVVRHVRRDQLDLASRCAGWSIRQVLDHSLGVTRKFADFASGLTDEPHAPQHDLLGEDHNAAVAREVAYARTAWNAADMTRTCRLGFGSFSADAAAGINLFDALAHTWDMSTRIPLEIPDDDTLWLVALDAAKEVIAPSRDRNHYAAEVPIAVDAPPMRHFLAYLGRSSADCP